MRWTGEATVDGVGLALLRLVFASCQWSQEDFGPANSYQQVPPMPIVDGV